MSAENSFVDDACPMHKGFVQALLYSPTSCNTNRYVNKSSITSSHTQHHHNYQQNHHHQPYQQHHQQHSPHYEQTPERCTCILHHILIKVNIIAHAFVAPISYLSLLNTLPSILYAPFPLSSTVPTTFRTNLQLFSNGSQNSI